ncbi:DUF808 domain-containing protein [Lutibaculum baratangense]|uniref:Putative Membrane protein n=1 Tax=Lutibaculum baratangense AMV1 TaxID=631454 RepID=V4RL62_9HYPH|nr:DUF808 domain-containing protein [Lutibaculum baratangense]ESR26796.1 putative Membrane protein [Lutibaculum baratangense AMV1]
MSTGLLALLDDVAGIAKVAAASLDDIAGQTVKAGAKAAGVVVDDTAVTPRYLVGFAAERELPIVRRIAIGSLRNKLVFLLPAALALSAFLPWLITPLLMIGGIYLCYEGAEKLLEAVRPHAAHGHEKSTGQAPADPKALEDQKVAGAIRTDFILSAEVMAIALASLPEGAFITQAVVLALVGIAITALVYGAVALIVKADDAGLAMANGSFGSPGLTRAWRATGRGIVRFMPAFMKLLAAIGTAAMLWVGGGIVLHGLEELGFPAPYDIVHLAAEAAAHALAVLPHVVEWLVGAFGAGVAGILIGGAVIPVATLVGAAFSGPETEPGL